MKTTAKTFLEMKQQGQRITEITCYDYTTAKLVEASGINAILVGDSLGNTMLGYPDTLSVTMEDMIHHSIAVSRACSNTMVIMDMPFMSYQASVYEAVTNAGRLMKEGRGNAVKLEGGAAVNVLDGNPDTYWHSMKGVTVASYPHDIRLNLGGERNLKGIMYRGAKVEGVYVKDYEVYVSNDGENWGQPVARGVLENNDSEQQVYFFAPARARFIRFVAISSHSDGDFAAVSELDVILAD